MKLVEIKNSLAKLYYEPADFKLVLSDFLTIDDGNQKILSQVVSLETTSNENTNCAVLKFTLDLNADGTFCSYSGYVPPLDALVSKTPKRVLQSIYTDNNGINLGITTNTSELDVDIRQSVLDEFLYIQSDRHETSGDIINKILDFNFANNKKTLYLDFNNLEDYNGYSELIFGKDFKLPINSAVLNYIYENDLNGLDIEQKAIVQDIIIEMQEYISTLESGYLPFNTLYDVVNGIYEEDKSVGIILLRNKLLKYKQAGFFASNDSDFSSLLDAMNDNSVTVLKLHKAEDNWKTEVIDFILEYVDLNYTIIFEALDTVINKEQINKLYKLANVNPIIVSKYETNCASYLKAFARNLLLFKPLMQQKAFATYNSFLNKLSEKEFIISGEVTYYTPIIVKEIPDKLILAEKVEAEEFDDAITQKVQEIQAETELTNIDIEPIDTELEQALPQDDSDDIQINTEQNIDEITLLGGSDDEEFVIDESDLDSIEDYVEIDENDVQDDIDEAVGNIEEESIEQEIAKDVDEMFYANSGNESEDSNDRISDDLVNIDVELVNNTDDEPKEDLLNDELFSDETVQDEVVSDDSLMEDDLSFIDEQDDYSEIVEPDILSAAPNVYNNEMNSDLIIESDDTNVQIEVPNSNLNSVPVYKTELDEISETDSSDELAEGTVVYHEKYGRGVVEQLMNYGNKTFCSVIFDNVGRRLMDPKLADLKQM